MRSNQAFSQLLGPPFGFTVGKSLQQEYRTKNTEQGISKYGGNEIILLKYLAVSYHEFKKGTDFTPILKGLPNDMCPCPHYGYIFEGAFRFIYADGSEEVYRSGEVYYAPAPHNAIVDEDTRLLDFSPQHEHDELMEHVSKVMQQ